MTPEAALFYYPVGKAGGADRDIQRGERPDLPRRHFSL